MKKIIRLIPVLIIIGLPSCFTPSPLQSNAKINFHQKAIIQEANNYLKQSPVPITAFSSTRSQGGIHDFYSEGDYWWPNPKDLDGPYIRKDGQTNPDNFISHRIAMRNLSRWVATLVAAYQITGDQKYADHALKHLNTFFVNPITRMNPNLLFAQAIKGKVSGRGIGIIDTIHLIEVAQSIEQLIQLGYLDKKKARPLKKWFNDYVEWMNNHPYGKKEKNHGNNHSTWWAAQVAVFGALADRPDLLDTARQQFKILLDHQMDKEGKFPDELKRSKAYNYSLFNLEAYSIMALKLSTDKENLWEYQGKNGSIKKAWIYMTPYIKDKSNWPLHPDIQHFNELPIQSPGILFAALAYSDSTLLNIWKQLSPERSSPEIDRNFPIRQPMLWLE